MRADLFTDDPAPSARRLPSWLSIRHVAGGFDNLKVRLTLGGLLLLLAGMGFTAWQADRAAVRDQIRQVRQHEEAETRRVAASLGQRVDMRRHALGVVALELDRAALKDPARASEFLRRQPLLRAMFSGVFIADADGRVLVFHDEAGPRFPDTMLGDRDYFKRMRQTQKGVIAEPVMGRVSKEPVLVFAQPVIDGERFIGMIAGSMRLASRDLLTDLGERPAEPADSTWVVTDRDGRVIAHPERARLAERLDSDPRFQAAFVRWATSGRPMNETSTVPVDGQDVVLMAGDPNSGWRVWRHLASAKQLAPLRQARADGMQRAVLLALVLAALFATYLWWQLRPLARLERRAAALMQGDASAEWPDESGEIGRLARTLRHVWAERSQMEAFNAQVLQKLGSVMAAAPVGLAFTRHQRFELVSTELCKLLGYQEDAILGTATQSIFASNEDYAALGPKVGAVFSCGQPYMGEWQLLRADGTVFWAMLRARPVSSIDPEAGTIWSINDVHEQVLARTKLEHAARHDALTGVVNRQGFDQELHAVFDGQPISRPASLVMIDLDHFKPINDTAGHAAGDAMLVAVAQAIASRVRASDIVVRLGGDEFALLLRHCDHDRAMSVAGKVKSAIDALSLTWETHTLKVGASLGVVELNESHESAAQWLALADAACYEAKRAGRGTVRSTGGLRVVTGGAA